MEKNILVLVGGGIKHVSPFLDAGRQLDVKVTTASFSKLEYKTDEEGEVRVFVQDQDLAGFDVVYFRLVGKRYEDAALVVYYLRQKGVRLVDHIYETNGIIRVPLPKSIETKMLVDAGIPVPRTYFGRMNMIRDIAPKLFGYPFVIKGTTGKQGNAVWSPRNPEELDKLVEQFTPLEKSAKARFLAQEFVAASQRNRIFVVGGQAVAAITRPTRWRKRFMEKVNGEIPEGTKGRLDPIPTEDAQLAIKAAAAVKIDIGGADVITEDSTGKNFILEVNSAPRWAALKKDTGINVEEQIVKYLSTLQRKGI